MYSLHGFGNMLLDRGRTRAFAEGLRAYVQPDSVVIDIGCGPGILSLLACRFGARRVYAIEPDDIICCARDAATANGFADRIVFLQGLSTALTLSEKADIVVADIRGVLPFFGSSITSLIDARTRLLASDGIILPHRDKVWVALVEEPAQYEELVGPWSNNEYQLAFPEARAKITNSWEKARFKPGDLVTSPVCWHVVDYSTVNTPHARGTARWVIHQPRTAHGLALWFDSEISEDHGYSNSPLVDEKHIYGNGFFPLTHPVELCAGDWVQVDLRADLAGGQYIWSWNTSVGSGSATLPRQVFRQSTFLGMSLSRETLRKKAHSFVPTLNEAGAIDRTILDEMGTGLSLEQIARKIAQQFPGRFRSWSEALTRVGEISAQYGV